MKQQKRRYGMGGIYRPKGCKNWTIYYSDPVKRKRIREATGSANYAEAQQMLKRRIGDIAKGEAVDPKTEKIKVSELWEPFVRDRKINGRKLEFNQWRWTKHVEPFFGLHRAADIGTDLLNEYIEHRQSEKASNGTVNREIAVLRGMLRLGFKSKPQKVKTLPIFPHLDEKNNIRTGFLDSQKYQTLADNCNKIGLWMRAIFEIAYKWGWRKGELRMQVRQVDFEANEVRLDAHMTKNKKGRVVKMTPTIRALLVECARGKKPTDALFTREDGTAANDFRGAWRRLCVESGVGHMECADCNKVVTESKCTCGRKKRRLRYRGLMVHDLRRTAVRNLVRAGVTEKVAMTISGHKTRTVFDRYDIVDERDISNAMLKLEEHSRNEIVTKSVTNDPAEHVKQALKPN
jgi:site-specific recombinase XerD